MFREMRRKKQALSPKESIAVLKRGTSGVLALSDNDDYSYAVPLSYVYKDHKVYFHCAYSGHKIDALKAHPKVSFCVIDKDQIVPEEFTTYFRSVIIFGKARILDDETEKRTALELFAAKYSPDHKEGCMEEIDKLFQLTCMVEIEIDHMSGKEAIELVQHR